ncbi:MAG: lysostaphin resistance A-like protein [Bulleidia sp.]
MKVFIRKHFNLRYILPYFIGLLSDTGFTILFLLILKDRAWAFCLSSCMTCIFPYLFVRRDLQEEQYHSLQETADLVFRYVMILLAVNIVSNLCTQALTDILESCGIITLNPSDIKNQKLIDDRFATGPLPSAIMALLAGFSEEIIYRYAVFRLFRNRKAAFVISIAAFAMAHVTFSSMASILSSIVYSAMSFVLTFLYYRYDDIRINAFVHTLNNAFVLFLM